MQQARGHRGQVHAALRQDRRHLHRVYHEGLSRLPPLPAVRQERHGDALPQGGRGLLGVRGEVVRVAREVLV